MLQFRSFAMLSLLALAASTLASAKSPCPTQNQNAGVTRSGELVCLVPQVYGPGGLVGSTYGGPLDDTKGHSVHFQASALSSFGPINSEIGVQLSQVPLATPVSGFIFENGVMQEATSFGPVLTDRAETLGKRKLFVGLSYEYFNFDKADGVNLKNFGAVFKHEAEVCVPGSSDPCDGAVPLYSEDVIATNNRIDLKVHQVTFVGTYGIADKLDVSIAVPVLDVRMGMTSNATIFGFEPPPVYHTFFATANNPHETHISSSNAVFLNSNSSIGIGDLRLRGKYVAWRGASEKAAVAVGLDVRLPTGDASKFLGSGTWGLRPFMIYTYSARISPHASAGFEGNGNSILAGDVTTEPITKSHLPDVFTYSAGADASILHWLGLSADFIGTSLLNASRIHSSSFTDHGGSTHQDISTSIATVNQASISVGAKLRPRARLLVTGNVLFRVNDAGLHSKPAPLIGVSYTF